MGIGRTPARGIPMVIGLSLLTGPALAQDAAGAAAHASRPIRMIYPGPDGSTAVRVPAPRAAPPSAESAAKAQPSASESETPEKAAASPAPAGRSGADTVPEPSDSTLVDINSASSEELDRLGGRFGKAIVRGRPYQSIDELVSRRILNRSTFGQIRDRITVR